MPKVLLIDPSPTTISLHARQLRELGFQPIRARDGITGLKMFEEHGPVAVLTDLNLPALDGFAVLRRIRAGNIPTKVVIVTADPPPERVARALQLGADAVLTKPLSEYALAELLKDLETALQPIQQSP